MKKWARGGFLAGKVLCRRLTCLALLLQRREEAQRSGRGVRGRLGGVRTLLREYWQTSQALWKRQCHRQRSPAFRIRYPSWKACVLQSLIAKRSDSFIERYAEPKIMNPTQTAVCLPVNPSENCNFEIQVLLKQENGLKGLQHFTSIKKRSKDEAGPFAHFR